MATKEPKTRYLEKDFQTDFNKWCKHVFRETAVFELKVADTSLPFSDVQEHQENALYNAHHGHIVFKIPDSGYQNPFDSLMMVRVPAYIVVMFHAKHRGQKEFFMIGIDEWLHEKQSSERKSLTPERAGQIGVAYSLS